MLKGGGKGQPGGVERSSSGAAGAAASMRSVPASPQPGRNKIWYPVVVKEGFCTESKLDKADNYESM